MRIVKEFPEYQDTSGVFQRRRPVVVQRDDGLFSLAEQYHYRSVYEGELIAEGWATLPSASIFQTVALAEAALTKRSTSED